MRCVLPTGASIQDDCGHRLKLRQTIPVGPVGLD